MHLLSFSEYKINVSNDFDLYGEQATSKTCNIIVFFRCSNKDDSGTDRNCSTSPAPSHLCETISEESEETTTVANTSTADDQTDTQQRVSIGNATFDAKSTQAKNPRT